MDHDPGARPRGPHRLHDHVALDEIELYGELLTAVAGADGPLSPTEIDRVLGVVRSRRAATLPARPSPPAATVGARSPDTKDAPPPPGLRPGGADGGRPLPTTRRLPSGPRRLPDSPQPPAPTPVTGAATLPHPFVPPRAGPPAPRASRTALLRPWSV
ncbi:hypothetical protein BJF83_21610 [Nocardiopsis sp. CNR-923]|uniref:hypothetical protein n=1 Tax=Nocardiopsis sp. CNR-923 TaxID=1904965 RepID=UPI00095C3627|nr:hypothetical protein [Nocardiopsis sp. CNR-923]OLT26324.1 hypothetical protein BJF83_21610 [Nocardiopsis sp. CNR-923]